MFEPRPITGIIESNNDTEAFVSFADGAQRLFERSTESEADSLAAFPVGGTASRAKRLPVCRNLRLTAQDVVRAVARHGVHGRNAEEQRKRDTPGETL